MARRATATREPIDLEPSGTVLADGTVPGRAVPWKSPTVASTGGIVHDRGYKAYQAWQEAVKLHARIQRPRRRSWPYHGDCELRVTFYLRPRGGRSDPDCSNLVKAFEDALQGEIYGNDTQIHRIRAERIFTSESPERVEYAVLAL